VSVTTIVTVKDSTPVIRSPKVRADLAIEPVGYLDRKVRPVPDLRKVWSYINPFMLFGRHLGYKGDFENELAAREPKVCGTVGSDARGEGRSHEVHEGARGVAIFEAKAEGERLHVFAPGDQTPAHTWNLKR
jgi:5-methyltetrahydrofolate--homocysteine methyltransferase